MDRTAYDVRRVRGYILDALRSFYPNGVSGGVLHRDAVEPVFHHLDWIDFLQQLDYLQDRGYVEPMEDVAIARERSAKKRLFRLTATGYDVAVGIVKDAVIEMEP